MTETLTPAAERRALAEKRRREREDADKQRRAMAQQRVDKAKADLPEKPVTVEARHALAQKRVDRAKSRFLADPVDAVHYPGIGEISRFGQDKGPVKRDTRQEQAEVDGQLGIVNRIHDGLDKMRASGHISPHELDAAREFQQAFRACGYDRVKTTNLTGASGGGASQEDHLVRTTEARNQVLRVMEMIGGADSPMWKAVFWIVGHGISMNEVGKRESGDVKIWSGFVRSALYLMGQDYQKRLKAKTAHRSSGRKNRNV